MKLKYNFVVREVGGKQMAVAVGNGSEQFNGLIKLNDTGKTIFEALADDTDVEAIVDRVCEEYDVSREDASVSVSEFVAKLRASGLIVE